MKCPICNNELRRSQKDPNYGLCDNCRKKIKWQDDDLDENDYDEYESPNSNRSTAPKEFIDSSNNVIKCPRCASTNINFQVQETHTKTSKKKTSLLRKMARASMVVGTAGLWAFVPGPDGKERAKVKSGTFAVCQSCGKTWKVK